MKKIFPLIIVLILVLCVCWPLLRPGFIVTDDADSLIIRFTAFFQSLREGQFPVRFLTRLNNSYGYPVANFVYPGFMYIGSFIHLLGFSFLDSAKILIMGSLFTGGVFLFLLMRQYTSWARALFAVAAFLFSPYLLFDIFVRGSIGELLSIAAISVVLYAVRGNIRFLVAPAVALLVLSHNSLALLFLGVTVAYIVFKKSWYLLWDVGLGLIFSAFFWVPALVEKRLVVFDSRQIADTPQYLNRFVALSVGSFVPVILALLFGVSSITKKLRREVYFWTSIVTASFLLTTPLLGLVWDIPLMSRLFQFPFRFLSIVAVISPIVVSMVLVSVKRSRMLFLVVFLALYCLASWIYSFRYIEFAHRTDVYYASNESTTTVADEFMPRWVSRVPQSRPESRVIFLSGAGTVEANHDSRKPLDVTVQAHTDSTVQIQIIYYPGWGATLDGHPLPIVYDNPNGFITAKIPQGSHRLTAEFRETPFRFFVDCISVAGVLVYVVVFGRLLLTKKRSRKQ